MTFTSNLLPPSPWRDPAHWLYGLGVLLMLAAAGILVSQARSSVLRCVYETGRCNLQRTSFFGSVVTEFRFAQVSRVEVSHARRRSSLTFITPGGAIAFAHDTAYPPARDIARQFDAFSSGQAGPRLDVRHDQLPDAVPHAAVFFVIGLLVLAGGGLQRWLAKRSWRK